MVVLFEEFILQEGILANLYIHQKLRGKWSGSLRLASQLRARVSRNRWLPSATASSKTLKILFSSFESGSRDSGDDWVDHNIRSPADSDWDLPTVLERIGRSEQNQKLLEESTLLKKEGNHWRDLLQEYDCVLQSKLARSQETHLRSDTRIEAIAPQVSLIFKKIRQELKPWPILRLSCFKFVEGNATWEELLEGERVFQEHLLIERSCEDCPVPCFQPHCLRLPSPNAGKTTILTLSVLNPEEETWLTKWCSMDSKRRYSHSCLTPATSWEAVLALIHPPRTNIMPTYRNYCFTKISDEVVFEANQKSNSNCQKEWAGDVNFCRSCCCWVESRRMPSFV